MQYLKFKARLGNYVNMCTPLAQPDTNHVLATCPLSPMMLCNQLHVFHTNRLCHTPPNIMYPCVHFPTVCVWVDGPQHRLYQTLVHFPSNARSSTKRAGGYRTWYALTTQISWSNITDANARSYYIPVSGWYLWYSLAIISRASFCFEPFVSGFFVCPHNRLPLPPGCIVRSHNCASIVL